MKKVTAPCEHLVEQSAKIMKRPRSHGIRRRRFRQHDSLGTRALPAEVAAVLGSSGIPSLEATQLLLALPEYQVALPGGERATQTDVFAIARGPHGLVACAVEGKVDEEFGPRVDAKRREGAAERLAYLHDLLGIAAGDSGRLRYQLFHRTAAAILLAQQFDAVAAVLIVHSFSPTDRWFNDFQEFGRALGVQPERNRLASVGERGGVELFLGWVSGDQRFRQDLSQLTRDSRRNLPTAAQTKEHRGIGEG